MDDSETGHSHYIVTSDGQAQLDPVQQNTSFIVKLNNSAGGNSTSQIFPSYVTSSDDNSQRVNEDGAGIAFEIIQEPSLNDSVVENNRLFFKTDYSLDKAGPHQKEHQITVLGNRSKDDSLVIRPDAKQDIPLSNFALEEILTPDRYITLSSSVSPSQPQNSSVDSTAIKIALPKYENEKEKNDSPEVIKKTMVEAFVKMIVCRKITVEKRDAKTGDVGDVDVKLEEDEPVVIGVDYVETTEDVVSGHISKHSNESFRGTTTEDGGLKLLRPISGNSSKISKNIFSSSILQSTLQKGISQALQSDKSGILSKNSESQTKSANENVLPKCEAGTSKAISDSDDEWIEGIDDSEDYDPCSKPKLKQVHKRAKSILRDVKVLNDDEDNSNAVLTGLSETEKAYTDINLPKKRGRKRKWDRTIGLASNLKTCQFCNKNFDNIESCNQHMKKGDCVSSQFCFICSKTFESEEQLEDHITSHRHETKILSFDCMDCRRSYRTKAGYVKHFKMGTCKKRDNFEDGENGDYTCEMCDSRFSTVDYLQLHQYKVHENPKDRHICPDCGKTFYSLHGFQRHRSGRPCTEPLKCYICGKTYKAKESFKLHMKHHKSEITGVTYNCDECGRSYMTETALTKHKLLHTGVKPYKCEICGKEFAMRYQVKDHARMHTGEKPYSCTLCGVSFSNKGHLGRHIRSHENGTLFRRGRPKKSQNPDNNKGAETEIKLIDIGQTIQTIDGQAIQVVDGQIFNTQGDGTPMIIQADTNTIIIAEGWQDNSIPVTQAAISGENGENT